jgi:hypothetical protein
MAGLVPAIYVLNVIGKKDVDARDKPGHDEVWDRRVGKGAVAPCPPVLNLAHTLPSS